MNVKKNCAQAMFTIPEGQSFWQSFSNQVVHFKELTKNMSEEKVFSLMSDPACPGIDSANIFNNYKQIII